MDALPDSLRGAVNYGCADSWVGADDYFALVQLERGGWMVFVPVPGAKVEVRGPILASDQALDVAIEVWEEVNGRKVPSEFGFQKVEWVERF